MWKPTAVRLHVTGERFVLDGEQAGTGRLMIFRPPFANGMSAARALGKGVPTDQFSGLHFARGFCFDPTDTNAVWVADGGNGRILKLHAQTGAMLDIIGHTTFDGSGSTQFERRDGTLANMGQVDGDLGFDGEGHFYFTMTGEGQGLIRVPMPLQRNSQGFVKSDGQMLKPGWNQISGRTMQDHYGMAYAAGQLYGSDGRRLLVWTNVHNAPTFASADLVIGQVSLDAVESGGTFGGEVVGQMNAAGSWLFVNSSDHIFIFRTPVTSGGRNVAPFKILDGHAGSVSWDDDNSPVSFGVNGLAYDPSNNALWVSDYPHNRILRIRDPIGTTPRVDLVIGQISKTDVEQNHGLGLYATDATGLAAPWSLALDRFGNLYAVDSGFEGRIDNSGNLRVLRFDAASLTPVPGNIFPNPAASGVFGKPDMTSNRNWNESNRPNTPTFVAFDSQNRMVMLCDSYGNQQGQRVFWYPTPHAGLAPQPTHVINTSFGQAANAAFDESDNLIVQDHTWNRYHFYTWSSNAPVVTITSSVSNLQFSADRSHVALDGTNNIAVVGTMSWKTDAGSSGNIPAIGSWSITNLPLSGEATVIAVSGTNTAGFLGSDTITVARPSLPAPAIFPSGGSFINAVDVRLFNFVAGVEMRYTLDGSEPTTNSTLYSNTLTVARSTTLKARTFQTGRAPSPVSAAAFTFNVGTCHIAPGGGTITGPAQVVVTCDTPGAEIRYTLDGGSPTETSPLFFEPLVVYHGTLLVRGFCDGMNPGQVAIASFQNSMPSALEPEILPSGGLFATNVTITITSSQASGQIHYTLDGSEPLSNAPLYSGPLALTNSALVQARTYSAGSVPSSIRSANFILTEPWIGQALPVAGSRDRHTALGSDGSHLYFTRGNSANAPFHRIAKGATNGWTALASIPIPSTVNGDSGVGDLAFFDGALWTAARRDNSSSARVIYRYDVATNGWSKGAFFSDDFANAACAPVASNRIFAGWMGWTRIKQVTDWQAGLASDVGDLPGDASHPWDACVGKDAVHFLKHDSTATAPGVLASVSRTGSASLVLLSGLPFNPGMGCAIEYLPGDLFADGHERLFVLSGGTGISDGDGASWTSDASTDQLAILDLIRNAWILETLPFAVDDGSEMCLVDDTLYVLAANGDAQPLKLIRFQPVLRPAPLPLNIRSAEQYLQLWWDPVSTGFVLESATTVPSLSGWLPLTRGYGSNEYWFTPEVGGSQRFFRLHFP
jgi:sugar lactone lactonase YvrE